MTKQIKLAIFDIDGTIFRSSLVIEAFNALVQSGVFPKKASQRVERNYLRWLNRKGHYNDYLMALVYEFYKNLKGKRIAVVEPVIEQVVRWQKDRVYRFTRDLVQTLKKKGYFLIAVTNSPDTITLPFARSTGFSAVISRTPESRKGRYSGKISIDGKPLTVDAWIDKVALLKKFFRQKGMEPDLANSFAVGDSEGDIPLLEAVGHPIAFNPSSELARIARRRGWQTVIERKDVMYILKDARILIARERQHVRVKMQKLPSRRTR